MRRKPLKISWRAWCLYKLAVRDYSAFEMEQAIAKRASDSDQEIDPGPIVESLVKEDLINDERYVQNQISIATNGYQLKGPREIRRKLETKGGIATDMIDEFVIETDDVWLSLAQKVRDQSLSAQGFSTAETKEIPIKLHGNLKQKLYRKGFTSDQIRHTMTGLIPKYEKATPIPPNNIQKQVEKLSLSGKGPRSIIYQLKQKGADESLIQEALDAMENDWVAIAKNLVERRYGTGKRLTMKERKKQSDFLARRGFSMDQIRAVFND